LPLHRVDGVLFRELEGLIADAKHVGKKSSVRDDVPAETQSYVLVGSQTVTVIPEVVLGVHVFEVKHCVLSSQDDFVPQDNLRVRGWSLDVALARNL
jgi:hypothetical protein